MAAPSSLVPIPYVPGPVDTSLGIRPMVVASPGDLAADIEFLESEIYRCIQASDTLRPVFGSLKKENLWQLVFMERDKISSGKLAYESDEEGYLQGIYRGYLHMLQTVDDVLTTDSYQKLHDECSAGVKSKEEKDGIPLGFRKWEDGGECFALVAGVTLSEKGVQELIERCKLYTYEDETRNVYNLLKDALEPPKKTIIDATAASLTPTIRLKPTRPETCRINVQFCIMRYRLLPKTTEDEKLHAIARLCQDLDQLHVFVDGNIRTTGILVLNKLLIENGLSPCVMRDVNQLDCLSEEELVAIIKEGQEFFQRLKLV